MQRIRAHGLAVGWLCLLAAGPGEPGTEVGFGLGGQHFTQTRHYGGCSGMRYRYDLAGPVAQGALRHGWESGVTLSAEATAAPQVVVDRQLEDWGSELVPSDLVTRGVGAWEPNLLLSARLGWHWDYLGGEVGPGLWWNSDQPQVGHSQVQLLPSASLWLGLPEYVYVYGGTLRGTTLGSTTVLDVGLGHRSAALRAELGRAVTLQSRWGWVLRGQVPVQGGWWVGGELDLARDEHLAVAGSAALTASRSW